MEDVLVWVELEVIWMLGRKDVFLIIFVLSLRHFNLPIVIPMCHWYGSAPTKLVHSGLILIVFGETKCNICILQPLSPLSPPNHSFSMSIMSGWRPRCSPGHWPWPEQEQGDRVVVTPWGFRSWTHGSAWFFVGMGWLHLQEKWGACRTSCFGWQRWISQSQRDFLCVPPSMGTRCEAGTNQVFFIYKHMRILFKLSRYFRHCL